MAGDTALDIALFDPDSGDVLDAAQTAYAVLSDTICKSEGAVPVDTGTSQTLQHLISGIRQSGARTNPDDNTPVLVTDDSLFTSRNLTSFCALFRLQNTPSADVLQR